MAERKSLSTRRGREAAEEKPPRREVDKALDEVKETSEKRRRIPYDASQETHKRLSAMRVNSEANVPVRAFIDEANSISINYQAQRVGVFLEQIANATVTKRRGSGVPCHRVAAAVIAERLGTYRQRHVDAVSGVGSGSPHLRVVPRCT